MEPGGLHKERAVGGTHVEYLLEAYYLETRNTFHIADWSYAENHCRWRQELSLDVSDSEENVLGLIIQRLFHPKVLCL